MNIMCFYNLSVCNTVLAAFHNSKHNLGGAKVAGHGFWAICELNYNLPVHRGWSPAVWRVGITVCHSNLGLNPELRLLNKMFRNNLGTGTGVFIVHVLEFDQIRAKPTLKQR